MELSLYSIILLSILAVCTGINKTGIPGFGIVVVVLLPMVMPAKISTGYLLPLLVFADIFAIIYWRKKVLWRIILGVAPWMFCGIVCGYLLMDKIPENIYAPVLGIIVISLLVLDLLRRHFKISVPTKNPFITAAFGIMAGILTMLANAAGAVMLIYFLSLDLNKEDFVGTSAWLYFFFNLIKVPFSFSLGLITLDSLSLNLKFLPFIIVGAFLGIIAVKKIPQKKFNNIMWVLALAGGIKLLLG